MTRALHKNPQTGKLEIIKTSNFLDYPGNHDHAGFSFTVESELDAYKAAYEYRYCRRVEVKFAGGVKKWQVSVYTGGR